MGEVNYPNGMKRKTPTTSAIKTRNAKKARLGTDFETMINESNNYYLQSGIAAIYKKPTPIQVVKVDYPTRTKAMITEAYYKIPSTTDYNGLYKGQYIDFEAKSCQEKSFSFNHIYHHQIEHLANIERLGGIAFLLIEFSSYHEVYLLEASKLISLYKIALDGGRKSIPYQYFKTDGHLVEMGYQPRIDYLKVIDKIYIKNKETTNN